MAKKERKQPEPPSQAWLGTYGDMITLMLCFFVMLFNPSEVDIVELNQMVASLSGDPAAGGQSLSTGKLADLGNTINSMPSMEKGKSLGLAVKRAVSLFAPDVKSNKITITSDERGLVISLASDSFFEHGSATLDMELARDSLLRLAQFFLAQEELAERRFRIEGHTDNTIPNAALWPSNWELSTARATNVLHYLTDFGADEQRFSVAGYADTQQKFSNDTPEGQAYNRRVDIIILDDGHF
ncbi:MAG: flagellar motor protein MotB [Treponema sp.]|nr:flagellar motor protein MotB [Treponema sp.]